MFLNALGVFFILLSLLGYNVIDEYFGIAFFAIMALFVCNLGLLTIPFLIVVSFIFRWAWVIPILYGPGLFVWQVYTYLRYGNWVSISTMEAVTKIIDPNILYNPNDWKGLIQIIVNIFEFMPYSLMLFLLGALWLIIVILNWDDMTFESYGRDIEEYEKDKKAI